MTSMRRHVTTIAQRRWWKLFGPRASPGPLPSTVLVVGAVLVAGSGVIHLHL